MLRSLLDNPKYKWWVFGAIGIGTFFSAMDQGSVNIALPRIESHFQTDLPTVQWVVVGYALAISVLLLPMGRLGDVFDRKTIYMMGLVLFVAGAMVAGVSTSVHMVIGAKVLQGAGSAMIQGNAMAAVISVFPGTERGKVLGLHVSVVGVGIIVGPALGGALVSAFDWRAVFFSSVGGGLTALLVAYLVLDKSKLVLEGSPSGRDRFDVFGAALCGGFLMLFLLVMTFGNRVGWDSSWVLAGMVGIGVCLVLFVWWELRAAAPMLDVRIFTRKVVGLGVAAGWLNFLASSSVIFLMPFYLQRAQDFTPGEAGLVMVPGAICLTVFGPLSGRLSDRFGWRRFTLAGLALSITALILLASNVSLTTPLVVIVGALMLNSAGMGLFTSPNTSSIMSGVERSEYGVVTALTQLVRNSGQVTSIATATAIVVATMSSLGFEPTLDAVNADGGDGVASAFILGMHRVFWVAAGVLGLAFVLTFFKGERAKSEAGVRDKGLPRQVG